ncbi:MAG: TolC family protein [Neisseria zoodegmatis]|uniref:TolC family protein n=1 Tax=Neisseria zoodegmatis TaxID=326523 RepID=UPI0026EE24CF|nr:TolC family protein [Neisseria zoodegmatis]MDO5069575.1 TolC family protein [Neisseria zoodegmatis]
MKPTRLFQTALSLSIALALGGCAVNHTARPDLTLEAGGVIVPAAEAARRYHITENWWRIYADNRLDALVEQALANNIDLKKAAINVNKALYQANILGAGLVPAFNASVGASANKNLKDGGGSTRSFSSQLGLSYEIDLWQRLNAKADAQVWEYQATQQDLAATRLTLINNVVDAYFNIAYLNEAIALTEKTVKQYQDVARIAAAKYKHGKADAAQPRRAEQSLLSAQNSLIQLRNNRAAAEETLRNLLNLKPGETAAAAPDDFRLHTARGIDLNVPVSALANRPDLRAAEYRLQSAVKNVDAQKRSWYPTITVGATVSTSSDKARTLFDVPFLGGSVKLNLPFLDWNTLKWQDKTAEANFEQARLHFEQTLTAALNEVLGNYQKYGHAAQALDNARKQYALDQKNSRYYQVRYQYGKNELKDWLEALNTEYSSAQNMLNRRYETLKYESMVYKAMAGRHTAKAMQ